MKNGIGYWSTNSARRLVLLYGVAFLATAFWAVYRRHISIFVGWSLLLYVVSKIHIAFHRPTWKLQEDVSRLDNDLHLRLSESIADKPFHNLFNMPFNRARVIRGLYLQALLSPGLQVSNPTLSQYRSNYRLAVLVSGSFLVINFFVTIIYVFWRGVIKPA